MKSITRFMLDRFVILLGHYTLAVRVYDLSKNLPETGSIRFMLEPQKEVFNRAVGRLSCHIAHGRMLINRRYYKLVTGQR